MNSFRVILTFELIQRCIAVDVDVVDLEPLNGIPICSSKIGKA
jgi:hypothetical protein